MSDLFETFEASCKVLIFEFVLILTTTSTAHAFFDATYGQRWGATAYISEHVQEEAGYASGLSITDFGAASMLTPHFEVGVQFRYINGYGPPTFLNVADSSGTEGGASTPVLGPVAPNGFGRPHLRARQLIYGDFHNGRWYILELGFPFFNVTGFTNEYYRFWSQRIALHEALSGKYFDSYFELGATIRSLSDFAQPRNTALSYPPSVDGLAGIDKNLNRHVANGDTGFHIATDFCFEQALTETTMVGSNLPTMASSEGAATWIVYALEFRYAFNNGNSIVLRGATRVFRWPDDDNFALWSTFEEGNLGRSLDLAWRWQW